jgi:uncharacterized protein (DUF2147 family)
MAANGSVDLAAVCVPAVPFACSRSYQLFGARKIIVLAALGAAHRLLASATRGLSYLSESAFPVYWLHQSAIVLIGYFVIRLDLGIAAKYAVLLAASVCATLAVYHFGIRRFTITRFCVGMKSRPAPHSQAALVRRAAAVLVIGAATALSPRAADGATAVGRWYAEGGAAQVEISQCGDRLCGRVVWLRSPFDGDGCDWRDNRNPEPTLRARPIIGLQILAELHPADDARSWTGGTIYDPTSGRTYRCTLELDGDNRARVRGYIGVPLLGRTTTWIRVGTENQMCNR